eukprot:5165388-Pleurochrysis_carterae.AAC.1
MTACGNHFSYNAPPGPPWDRQPHQKNYRVSTEQALEGRARFESVVRTDSLNHARVSWQCGSSGGCEQAQMRGLGRTYGVARGRGAH